MADPVAQELFRCVKGQRDMSVSTELSFRGEYERNSGFPLQSLMGASDLQYAVVDNNDRRGSRQRSVVRASLVKHPLNGINIDTNSM
jgi:hypothetical protein